jgi:hypothetical protein
MGSEVDKWTSREVDKWTSGQVDKWTSGQVDEWTRSSESNQSKTAVQESMTVLSIGTGKERKKYDCSKAQKWGLLGWARPVVDILLSSSAEVVDFQMRQIFSAAGRPDNYIRLEPAIGKAKPDMDDASDDNIQKLTDAAHAFIEENIERLENIVKIVIND